MSDLTSQHSLSRQGLYEEAFYARRELMRSLMFLNEKEATATLIGGDWCVRDVISHITARECTLLAAVKHLLEDGGPRFRSPLDVQEFNRRAVNRRRDLALSDVVDELDGVRQQLSHHTRKLRNRDLFTPFAIGRTGQTQSIADVLLSLLEHDYEHVADIWRWRVEQGLLKRSEFRYVVTAERNALLDSIGGLSEKAITSVKVCGEWTISQVLSHLLSWDEEALRTVEHWTGDRSWQEGSLYDDEWNEEQVAQRADLTPVDLVDGLTTCHRKLMQLFDGQSDEGLTTLARAPWGERMSLISFYCEMARHDAEHYPDIRAL